MYLKEIEIKGFKSFANKIKLNITSGITVIVGPNGCGKSNITDAVRWILGEQNIRSLRGNKITDMIFAGSKEQKLRNIAEVSMLFDNNDRKLSVDAEEIEIKRMIYRSGETENYINNQPCRLRDIQDLFSGTGLGKNSYSIIAQGKVDFILNARPTERRILFEEAANISSYNHKKETSLKKLDLVENNLLRVNDILSEIKTNLSNYQKKANDLKTYQLCREHIRKLEFYVLSQHYFFYQKNSEKYEKRLIDLHREIVEIERKSKDSKNEIFRLESEKNNLENKYYHSDTCIQEIERKKNRTNNQLILLKQRNQEIYQNIKKLQEDIQKSGAQFEKFTHTISNIDQDIQKTKLNSKSVLEKYEKTNLLLKKYCEMFAYYEHVMTNTNKDIKTFHADYLNQYREKNIKEKTELESIKTYHKQTEKEVQNLKDILGHHHKRYAMIEKNANDNENEIKELQKTINPLTDLLAQNKEIIVHQNNRIAKINNDIILKTKEKDFLEELIKNNPNPKMVFDKKYFNQKFGQDIKCFPEIDHYITHIPDQIKNIIDCILKDKKYILNITHLEKISIIEKWLEENHFEEIKLIADDMIPKIYPKKETEQIQNILKKPKVLGFAHQMISYLPDYHNVFEVLLGHILIVEDMPTALELSRQLEGSYVVVSLDGLLIDSHGLITLNFSRTSQLGSNSYFPIKRIEQLKRAIKDIGSQVIKYKEILYQKIKENKKLFQQIESIKDQLEFHNKNLNQGKKNLLEIKEKIVNLENQSLVLHHKRDQQKDSKHSLEQKVLISQASIDSVEAYLNHFDSYFQSISKVKNLCEKNINTLRKNLQKHEMELHWDKERDSMLQKRKKEMDHFIQSYHQDEKERQAKIKQCKSQQGLFKKQEFELIEKINQLMGDKVKLNKKRLEFQESVRKKEIETKGIGQILEKNQKEIDEKRNRYHKDEMNQVQNKEKINNLLLNIRNQYNSSIKEIILYQNEANGQKEASKKIADYKEKISSMGQINFDAQQEYQKHLSRYTDLQEKKEEIIKSREKLFQLIDEIDRVAQENFHQTFIKVENYFKDIFTKLFTGGQVSLELSDNKKILEAGIEVMVQPPGKELQNISLMSTGERALTAIALLVALWKANPSPFCFFDEIDSALDEANALRLSYFLKNEDLKDAQIIIITHQKEIMEAADALYGITMEGSGMSKLMSVKMLDSGEWKN